MTKIVKKPEERKMDILHAARHLFLTQDYDKTTMQDVMDYLNIAKGTIYHYFKSKAELLEAVVENIVDTNIAEMLRMLEKTKGNALKKLQMLIQAGNLSKDQQDLLYRLHSPNNAAMHTRLLATTIVKQAVIYGKIIQQGCEEGIFQTETPHECAEFILSAVQFLTDTGIYPWSGEDLTRRAQTYPAMIEALLKAPQGSFNFLLNHLS